MSETRSTVSEPILDGPRQGMQFFLLVTLLGFHFYELRRKKRNDLLCEAVSVYLSFGDDPSPLHTSTAISFTSVGGSLDTKLNNRMPF